jgi:hypothetical protein
VSALVVLIIAVVLGVLVLKLVFGIIKFVLIAAIMTNLMIPKTSFSTSTPRMIATMRTTIALIFDRPSDRNSIS